MSATDKTPPFEDFRAAIRELISGAEREYERQNSSAVRKFLREIDERMKKWREKAENSTAEADATDFLRSVDSHPFLSRLRDEFSQISSIETILKSKHEDGDGWTLVRQSEDLSTYYRAERNTPIHSIKVVGTINASILPIVAVIAEVDLLPEVITMLKLHTEVLHEVTDFRKIVYGKVGLPLIFKDRDVVGDVRGHDFLEEKGYVVLAGRSIDSVGGKETEECELPFGVSHDDVRIPEEGAGSKRVAINLAGAIIRPISENKCELAIVSNVDFRMSIVPQFIINFLTRNLAWYGFVQFRAMSADLSKSKKHGERIRENRRFYGEIERRLERFYEKRNAQSNI